MYEFYEIDCLKYKTNRQFQMCIFDPPYGIGQNYTGFKDDQEYFNAHFEEWIVDSYDKMSADGSWYGFIIGENHYRMYNLCKKIGLDYVSTLQWYYEFGQDTLGKFTSLTTPILYMVKDYKKRIWNKDTVKIASARKRYGDKRANPQGKSVVNVIVTIGGHIVDIIDRHDPGTFFETLLSHPRVMGNFKERARFSPNQIPVELLMRLIACSTNPGDWIYDPFAGSGSTAIASHFLRRNCVLCDIETSDNAIEHIESYKRIFSERSGLPLVKEKEWSKNDPAPIYADGKWQYPNIENSHTESRTPVIH